MYVVGMTIEHPVGKDPEIVAGHIFTGFPVAARSGIARLCAPDWTELPHVTGVRLNRVSVVVQFAVQSRMHAGQVIALKIIVNVGLPVTFHLISSPLEQLHAGKIETLQLLWEYVQTLQQWLGIRIAVDEDQVEPLLGAHRRQREVPRGEAKLAFEPGSADQRAIEPICPTVIPATEKLAGTAAFSGRPGAMAANIVEAAQLAGGTAHQQQGLALEFRGKEITWIRQLVAMAHHLPGLAEDLLLLRCEHGWIGIKRS